MALEVITLEVYPLSPEVDMDSVSDSVEGMVKEFVNDDEVELRKSKEPYFFGMDKAKIIFVRQEGEGDLEELKSQIAEIEGVKSAEVVDQRRAIG